MTGLSILMRRPGLVIVLAALLLFPAGAAGQSLDPVLASIDGRLITARDLRMEFFEARLAAPGARLMADEELAAAILPDAIAREVLYGHFWQADMEPDPGDIEKSVSARMELLADLAGGQRQFASRLEEEGLDRQAARRALTRRLEKEWFITRGVTSRLDPALLNRSEDSTSNATRVRIAQIVLEPMTAGRGAATLEESRARAERVSLHIREGFSFAEAARVFSDGPMARQGGDLGWVEVDQLDPTVRDAVLALRPGGVTEPIQTPDGHALYQLVDFESPASRELHEQALGAERAVLARAMDEADIRIAPQWEDHVLRRLGLEQPAQAPPAGDGSGPAAN